MFLHGYYQEGTKVIFAADVVYDDGRWKIVGFLCEELKIAESCCTLRYNRFSPQGEPFLFELNDLLKMRTLNTRCLDCFYLNQTTLGYRTPRWLELMKSNDFPHKLSYASCKLREDILINVPNELFCDCIFGLYEMPKVTLSNDLKWSAIIAEFKNIIKQYPQRQISNSTRYPSPKAVEWLFSNLSDKDICIFASGEKNGVVFENPQKYMGDERKDDRWGRMTISKENRGNYYWLALLKDNARITFMPAINTLIFAESDLQGYGQGYLAYAPQAIIDELCKIELNSIATHAHYGKSHKREFERIFSGPIWRKDLYVLE